MIKKLLLTLILLSIPPLLAAQADYNIASPNPFEDWQSFETEHFIIHYTPNHLEFARRMARIAESVHNKLTSVMVWKPREKTEIVVNDSVDFSNGGATVLPYNQFYIYTTPPVDGDLVDHNAWLELVFIHEYTHVLHLDQSAGFPGVLRKIFGRSAGLSNPLLLLSFPQIFAPKWVAEGIAVYNETKFPGQYGRLNSAYYQAKMRLEVERGLRSLTEESYEGYFGSRWPFGQIYLYGAYFFQFLADQYGEKNAYAYLNAYRRNFVPFRMDARARRAFNKSGRELWHDYQEYLEARFHPQLARIEAKGETPATLLTDEPYINQNLAPDDKGGLYYYHFDGDSHPEIRYLDAQGQVHGIRRERGVTGLYWRKASGLLVMRSEICDNINIYVDLYRLTPDGGLKWLTQCGRYPRAVWSPDGDAIAAVQQKAGTMRLVLLDKQGQHKETLYEAPLGDVIGDIDWSPNGRDIVASVKRQSIGWNLERFDLQSKNWTTLSRNDDIELQPRYSLDGASVWFVSDHDDIFNIRRLDLASSNIQTFSNTKGYIAEVAPQQDSLIFVEYTANSLAIKRTTTSKMFATTYAAKQKDATPASASIVNQAEFEAASVPKGEEYSPWYSMRPRGWAPIFFADSEDNRAVGVHIHGQDVLGFHQWSLLPLYYIDQEELGGFAAYTWYNRIAFLTTKEISTVQEKTATVAEISDDEVHAQVLAQHHINRQDWNLYLAAGVASAWTSRFNEGTQTSRKFSDNLGGFIVSFDNSRYYLNSISLTDGFNLRLSGERYGVVNDSDHTGNAAIAELNAYWGPGANHVLKGRALAAKGDRTIVPYQLGGNVADPSTLGGITKLGQRDFVFRGYPRGRAELRGEGFQLYTGEWRAPLVRYYDGWFVPPFGIGKLNSVLFVDTAKVTAPVSGEEKFRTSAGVELGMEILIGYDLIPLALNLGYAHGFDKELGEDQIYLVFKGMF